MSNLLQLPISMPMHKPIVTKKAALFDLDGVLVDAKLIHYQALNKALPDPFKINYQDHIDNFDGLKTRDKLSKLSAERSLPTDLHDEIFEKKQEETRKLIGRLPKLPELIKLFKKLRSDGIEIAVCSNSIRHTVITALASTGLAKYCSLILGNEDVRNPKPHPEIFWTAMAKLGVTPTQTLIVEDSPPGLVAAQMTGADVFRARSPDCVNINSIYDYLGNPKSWKPKWSDKKLNILIPMAGSGSRFSEAGFKLPKPLIDVRGKPMIQVVVENLGLDANFIFVVQKSHRAEFNLDNMLKLLAPRCKIIEVDGITEGAAITALKAKDLINNDSPLFFANSDQFVEWDPINFMYSMQERDCDGGIVTFEATHPKWSFAQADSNGWVSQVAEKEPISTNATVGFYYWKKGRDFVKYAEQMIEKDIRVNNEFYVCPVFNEAIADGRKILAIPADRMWGLGTPEDLDRFLTNEAGKSV